MPQRGADGKNRQGRRVTMMKPDTHALFHAFFVGVALMVGVGVATAQQPQASSLASADRKFVMEATQGSMAEVELGKLPNSVAPMQRSRTSASGMVSDHGTARDELAHLAQQKGVTPPAGLNSTQRKLHDRLAKLSGAEFDRVYVDDMVKDHRKDVAEFKKQGQQAKDPELKSWASKTLPTLQQHLDMAERLAAARPTK
jgi:putative membrane protein